MKATTIAAFSTLIAVIAASFILGGFDKTDDIYPTDDTQIRLYGESHGKKAYYDKELALWKECYDEGCRDLFVELPYYTADFLNFWMGQDSEDLIDKIFEEIQGTQSANEYYYEFFHEIKEQCPNTVFHGTDVGHQYDTTGKRYLEYLEILGLKDSEKYDKALACIEQGKEFSADDEDNDGISEVRESYMVSNFIDAYTGEKIMGIYGSYHTDIKNSNVMAGRLHEHYGDIISSVDIFSYIFNPNKNPYRFGFSLTGLVFLLMLYIPNIIWAKIGIPEGYEEISQKENRILLMLERVGQVLTTVVVIIFKSTEPYVLVMDGVHFEWRLMIWAAAFVLMILYEGFWIKYFMSDRRLADFYTSFAGFPLAGATLPVMALCLLGIYSKNLVIIATAVILGIGHIGIQSGHARM